MRFLFFITTLLCFLSSCDKAPPQNEHKPILRLSIRREPATLDPRKGNDLTSSILHYILFEGLVREAPDGSIIPAQAESIEISSDRKTYTFHLKETVWSDGTAVTAKDFEQAWKKILSPHFPAANAFLFYPIKNAEAAKRGTLPVEEVGIYALDKRTLKIELEKPTPYFLKALAFCAFFPISYEAEQRNGEWAFSVNSAFVSNGPFILKKWDHNNEIVFEKNPLYAEQDQIQLTHIHVIMVADEVTTLRLFESGELDIIGLGLSPLPLDAVASYKGALHTHASPGSTAISLNVSKFPFTHKKVRQALSLALNRQEIVDNLSQLGEKIATNLVPPLLYGGKDVSLFKDNNQEKALALFQEGLKELGVTRSDLPPLVYTYSNTEAQKEIAQAVQHQWKKVLKLDVLLEPTENKILLDRLGTRNYQMGQFLWIAQYSDPMNIFERFKSKSNIKNYPGWENLLFGQLLEETALDLTEEKRIEKFNQAEKIFIEEMPLIPLYHRQVAFMAKPWLDNLSFFPDGAFDYTRVRVKANRDE